MLEAKARVEEALTGAGVNVDGNVREAIGWRMSALVDRVGMSSVEAADRIIADYLEHHKRAA